MRALGKLFDNNRRWVQTVLANNPDYFTKLAHTHKPEYLWIGCADSRVAAETITGLDPGEMFVHRNIANLVVHTDMSMLCVLQYAIEVLRVRHIIVCGHYGCGGVECAMSSLSFGLIDNWLRHIKDIYANHQAELEGLDEALRFRRLCELNVRRQVENAVHSSVVQLAWRRGQAVDVHGWMYDLEDGLLKDQGLCVGELSEVQRIFRS